jgi:hypothetical protein
VLGKIRHSQAERKVHKTLVLSRLQVVDVEDKVFFTVLLNLFYQESEYPTTGNALHYLFPEPKIHFYLPELLMLLLYIHFIVKLD